MTNYSDSYVRCNAISSLAKLGDVSKPFIDSLLKLLKDDAHEVRSRAASSLGQLGDVSKPVIDGLLSLFRDSNVRVRFCSVSSIELLGDISEPVIDGLLELLKDNLLIGYTGLANRADLLTQLGKKSPKVLPSLVQWIEQNENQPYVGNGIDILSELI